MFGIIAASWEGVKLDVIYPLDSTRGYCFMGMVLDGIAASEQPDSSAEILDVKGCDISDLTAGRATLNWEHLGDKDPGHSANDHIGRITYAKKIFQRSDCENVRQREYWDFVQVPYIYIKSELFNEEGHPGAVAAAAMIRHYRNKGLPILIRYSIEGSTLDQEGPMLKRTIARRIAATIKPANKSAISGVISDGDDDKKKASETTPVEDPLAFLIGTKKHEHPDQRRLGHSPTIACDPELNAIGILTERLHGLKKALEAGSYNAVPSTLTGGAALQRESLGSELQNVTFKAKAKSALRDYDPDTHGEFKKYMKHHLPEASDTFIDRFADAVGDWKATRNQILTKAEEEVEEEPSGHVRSGSGMSSDSPAFAEKQKAYKHKLAGIKAQASQSTLPGFADMAPAMPPVESPEFKVKTRKKMVQGDAFFDHKQGVLHTADDSFKVYIPDLNDRGYGDILNDPDLNRIHDTALKNWMMVHKVVQSGKVPPEMVALSSLFSAMSPNTAVPVQELAYGHLQDLMGKPTGKGGFEGLDPTKELSREEYARYAKEWDDFNNGERLPEWERDHFAHRGAGIWTKEGHRHKIGLGLQKWGGVKDYHEVHKTIVDLVRKHGADARAISGVLNDMKARAGTQKQGDDPEVKHFAPKTIRYLLGMMGAGNCLDDKTEALTQRGWVRGFELKYDDIILTKNAQSNALEWQTPSRLHFFPDYDGDVVEIRSRSFHAVTTPEHRWLVTSKMNCEGRGGVVKEKTSSTLTFGADQIHRTGDFEGPLGSALTPDEAELLGWFVTDGGYKYKKNKSGQCRGTARFSPPGVYAYLTQSERGNPEKCLRISSLLARVDPEATTKLRPTGERVWKLSPKSVTMLYSRVPDRSLSVKNLLDLDRAALERLYEAMVLGDGSVAQHDESWSEQEKLATGRLVQAGAFQVLATLLGKSSNMTICPAVTAVKKYDSMPCVPRSGESYSVGVHVRKYALVEKEQVSTYVGKVPMWCVTVPNGFFVVRRSGQVYVTGNCIVPDTHFIRHTFGLHVADPKSDVLKKYLWNEHNEPLLGELDKYYYAHHPAVAHTRAKLQQQFGEDLGEQALFPSFWLHWLTIQPHEKRRGWFERGQAKNAETDHNVFWNSVKRVLDKYGIPQDHKLIKGEKEEGSSMAARVAHATKELENQFGFVPATLALYATMIPAVLNHKEPLRKMERLTQRLKELVKAEKSDKKPNLVQFGSQFVEPGELEVIVGPQQGAKFRLLNAGSSWNHFLNDSGKLMRVRANHAASRINSHPKVVTGAGSGVVDAKRHGVPGLSESPAQQELMHGIDMHAEDLPKLPGQKRGISTAGGAGWRKNGAGKLAYVKPSDPSDSFMALGSNNTFKAAHAEAAFHRLANDFFGLGEHVPVTTAFHHPIHDDHLYSAQSMVENGEHLDKDNEAHHALLHRLGITGQLDKLALMDMIMANGDRHEGNFMLTPGQAPFLHLIDNGLSFRGIKNDYGYIPDYWTEGDTSDIQSEPLHPEAANWAMKLDPEKLRDMMDAMGLETTQSEESVRRLQALQNRIKASQVSGMINPRFGGLTKMAAYSSPFTGEWGDKDASFESAPSSLGDIVQGGG